MIQQLIIQALVFALFPVSLSLLIDICLGKPAAEKTENSTGFDRKAIFFPFSLFLAKLRLKRNNQFKGLQDSYITNMNSEDPVIKHAASMDFKAAVFETGREFFSWELGFGMCPICTNIRVAIFLALIYCFTFSGNWFLLILIPCFSNMYLLFFNKLKF